MGQGHSVLPFRSPTGGDYSTQQIKLVTVTHQHGAIQTNKRAVEAKGLQHNIPAIYIQRYDQTGVNDHQSFPSI